MPAKTLTCSTRLRRRPLKTSPPRSKSSTGQVQLLATSPKTSSRWLVSQSPTKVLVRRDALSSWCDGVIDQAACTQPWWMTCRRASLRHPCLGCWAWRGSPSRVPAKCRFGKPWRVAGQWIRHYLQFNFGGRIVGLGTLRSWTDNWRRYSNASNPSTLEPGGQLTLGVSWVIDSIRAVSDDAC